MAVETSKTPKIVRNRAKIDQNEQIFDTLLAYFIQKMIGIDQVKGWGCSKGHSVENKIVLSCAGSKTSWGWAVH